MINLIINLEAIIFAYLSFTWTNPNNKSGGKQKPITRILRKNWQGRIQYVAHNIHEGRNYSNYSCRSSFLVKPTKKWSGQGLTQRISRYHPSIPSKLRGFIQTWRQLFQEIEKNVLALARLNGTLWPQIPILHFCGQKRS